MTFDPSDYDHAKGPGKYEGNDLRAAAAYVHNVTLNGFSAEECGTIEYGSGHYCLVYLDVTDQAHVIELGWTRDVDAAPESSPVAAIVHEDDRGFVMVTFYDDEDAAQADWNHVEGEYALLDFHLSIEDDDDDDDDHT